MHPPSPSGPKKPAGGASRPGLSALAVGALVVALVPCCPPTALLGAFLGMLALRRIQRSGGRLRGVRIAATAMIVGVVGSVVWLLAFQKFAVSYQQAQEDAMAQQVGAIVAAAQAGRVDEVRDAWFSADTAPTEAEILGFGEEVTARFGAVDRFSVLSTAQSGSFMAPIVEVAGLYRTGESSPLGSARLRLAFRGVFTQAFRVTQLTIEDAERGDLCLGGE